MAALLFSLFLLSAVGVRSRDPGTRPNIVLVIADDLGWGDVGCFGNTTLRTPNIDRLASEGARLTHVLAAASVCTPSRAALLTGRYPIRLGLSSSGITRVIPFLAARGGLPPSEITFARLAQGEGYATAHIGKWHLGLHCGTRDFCHHPRNHGYDYFYGLPWTNSRDLGGEAVSVDVARPRMRTSLLALCLVSLSFVWWSRHKGLGNIPEMLGLLAAVATLMFWVVVSNLDFFNGVLMKDFLVVEQPLRIQGIHQRFLREARKFVSEQVRREAPFLLTLAFTHVHTTLKVMPDFQGHSGHGPYGDAVEELDWAVGQVLGLLDQMGIAEDTFVAFTSDQGGHLEEANREGQRQGGHNGPFRGGKGMGGMEGGIRVPTLVRWPHHVPAGREVASPISLMDFFPTVASLVGAKLPRSLHLDGRSMLPWILNSSHQEVPRLLVHYCGAVVHAARWIESEDKVWKATFATPKFLPNTTQCRFLCPCEGPGVIWHEQPILVNVVNDPSESEPIPVTSEIYTKMLKRINVELSSHKHSIIHVENQLEVPNNLWLPWLQPCCQLPTCHCKEDEET